MACDLNALDSVERARHAELVLDVLASAGAIAETEDGYRCVFDDPARIAALGEWIALEHRCCPFLTFVVHVNASQLALDISGPPGVKEFLRMELGT